MEQNLDFLKPVLGDDLFGQFSEKINAAEGISIVNGADGSYIPKAKFDNEREASKALKAQIADLNGKLTALQTAADGNEGLKAQIAQLTQDIATKDAAMKKASLEFAVKDAVRASKARNADVVLRMVDMTKVSEDNGKLIGLNEQIESLKQTDAYLFEDAPGQKGGVDPHKEPDDSGKPSLNSTVNQLIRQAAGR